MGPSRGSVSGRTQLSERIRFLSTQTFTLMAILCTRRNALEVSFWNGDKA